MPVSDENLLLVEGESDRSFFEEVCTRLGLRARIRVFDAACPPFAGLSEWLRRIFP